VSINYNYFTGAEANYSRDLTTLVYVIKSVKMPNRLRVHTASAPSQLTRKVPVPGHEARALYAHLCGPVSSMLPTNTV
jgi:hypothetical protein